MSAQIIKSDGTKVDFDCPPVYSGQAELRKRLKEIVGGDIEHVFVEYNGERACMIVNETGAVQDPQLPINLEATRIYHTYPARVNDIPLDDYFEDNPKIYGDVVLLDGVRVE
jgi:hypothetical protein